MLTKRRPDEPAVKCDRCDNAGVYEYVRSMFGGDTMESFHLCNGCTAKALHESFMEVTEAQSQWNRESTPDVLYVEPPYVPPKRGTILAALDEFIMKEIDRGVVDVMLDRDRILDVIA